MNIHNIKISEIIPNKNNVKIHSNRQKVLLAEKMKKFGINQPLIIDKEMNLLVGHCRLESAKIAGFRDVPCVVYDNLTESEKLELMVADNKLNESDWDFINLLKIDENILIDCNFTLGELKKEINLIDKPEKNDFALDSMELLGFEKYDYLVVVFNNESDIMNIHQKLGIEKISLSFSGKNVIGIGRIITGEKLIKAFENVG